MAWLRKEGFEYRIGDLVCGEAVDGIYNVDIRENGNVVAYCAKRFKSMGDADDYKKLLLGFQDCRYVATPFTSAPGNDCLGVCAYVFFERLVNFHLWKDDLSKSMYTFDTFVTKCYRFGEDFIKVFSQIADAMTIISKQQRVVANLLNGGLMIDERRNIRIVNIKIGLDNDKGTSRIIPYLRTDVRHFQKLIEDCRAAHKPIDYRDPSKRVSTDQFSKQWSVFSNLVNEVEDYKGTDQNIFVNRYVIWVYRSPLVWEISKQANFIILMDDLLEVLHGKMNTRGFLIEFITWRADLNCHLRMLNCLQFQPEAHFVRNRPIGLIKFFRNYMVHKNGQGTNTISPTNQNHLTRMDAFRELLVVYPSFVVSTYRDLVNLFYGYVLSDKLGSPELRDKLLLDVLKLDTPTHVES